MSNNPSRSEGDLNHYRFRRFGLIALGLVILGGIPIALAFLLKSRTLLVLSVLILHWGIPLLAAFRIERRGFRSLGLFFQKDRIVSYAAYALIGYAMLTALNGGEWLFLAQIAPESTKELSVEGSPWLNIFNQLVFVGLPEEFLYRGYLQTRFCEWLGNVRGIVLASLLFGMVHTFSRTMSQGAGYLLPSVVIGISAVLGGLVLGGIYQRTRSIFPPAVAHILLNLFPLGSLLIRR